ncbi:MAG: hypothetical protein K1X74_08255 [Pirellulales bacterium]|nr:hypothetical protein [Pirellulales bacterium]
MLLDANGVIAGTKFHDLTGNGITPDDVPLPGTTIQLFKDNGDGVFNDAQDALVSSQVTNGSGKYSFEQLPDGTYFVREVVPPGATQTAPTAPNFYTVALSGIGASSSTDLLIDSFDSPTQVGYLINTVNLDPHLIKQTAPISVVVGGERDLFIDVLGASAPTSATGAIGRDPLDGTGYYNFVTAEPGARAILQYDGIDADDQVAPVSLVNNQGLANIDFLSNGNDRIRFDFLNVDGGPANQVQLIVRLTSNGGGTATFVGNVPESATALSFFAPYASFGTAGGFSFSQVTSMEVEFNAVGGEDIDFELDLIALSKVGLANPYDFANTFNGSISGTKFEDLTGNGITGDDPGFGGVTIELYLDDGDNVFEPGAGDTLVTTQVTAANGSYSFNSLQFGTYFVRELVPAGSQQTGGNTVYTINLNSEVNQVDDIDFANFRNGSIAGTKFTDLTGNGLTGDDTPRQGTTIELYLDDGDSLFEPGAGDALVTTQITAANGTYSFTNLGPGRYFVRELVPGGATQTAPVAPNFYTIVMVSGLASTANNFANFFPETVTGSISGRKVEDITGDGITNDDIAFAGVTIELYRDDGDNVFEPGAGDTLVDTELTAANGTYTFSGLTSGRYFVRELVPAGTTRTAPAAPGVYTVVLDEEIHNSTGNDFANFRNGSIAGTKFTDLTGNGLSGDDTPRQGTTIELYLDNGNSLFEPGAGDTLVTTQVTAANGTYSFTNLGPGQYFVRELVPGGATQTAPVAPNFYTIAMVSGLASTGNNFANFFQGSISGRKVEDITGDGITNDDIAFAGVTIELYRDDGDNVFEPGAGDTLVDTELTAANGTYTFTGLALGRYFVREIVPPGTTRTAPAAPGVYTVVLDEEIINSSGNDFANFRNGSISGTKFTDLTGNGLSGDDTPRAGTTIELYLDDNDGNFEPGAGDTLVTTQVTAANGTYSFTNLGPGRYFVREIVPAGASQTTPVSPAFYTIVMTSGLDSAENDFANFFDGSIAGKKVEDLTGNGVSMDDPAFAGVTIELFADDGDNVFEPGAGDTLHDSAVTAADGTYQFSNLPLGRYFIREVVPNGTTQTGATTVYNVLLTENTPDSTGNNFANFRNGSINGRKVQDLTGNGISIDDTALAGTTIQLFRDDGNGVFNDAVDTLVASQLTDATGNFNFANLGPGTYFVREIAPANSIQTGGLAVYTVVMTSNLTSNGNDFGNFFRGNVTGTKFNDLTGNGISGDDTPRAGVVIELYRDTGNNSFDPAVDTLVDTETTDASGNYTFAALGPGRYFVREIVPQGYFQTSNPSFYTIDLVSGQTAANNNFSNRPLPSSISGFVYIDVDNDGVFDATEDPIPGVTVTLTGTDLFGQPVNLVKQTDATGFYIFDNLLPGTYKLNETQPANFIDGIDTIGTPGGTTSNDMFSNINLPADFDGVQNNFGERGKYPSKGDLISSNFPSDSGNGSNGGGESGVAGAVLSSQLASSTVSVFNPVNAMFYIGNTNAAGAASASFAFGAPGFQAVAGDWDGDGVGTIGVFDPASATFYLRNSNTAGAADYVIRFGASGWTPVVGDWNNDGIDTIGVYDPASSTFYLRNANTSGAADAGVVAFGAPGFLPVVGDWNGDGSDTVGVFNPVNAVFYLRNSNTAGAADAGAFVYGPPGARPIAGDWDGDGSDSIGVQVLATSTFFLRNSNSSGAADVAPFQFGGAGFQAMAADFDGSTGSPLRAATPAASGKVVASATLSGAPLNTMVDAAVQRWAAAGLNATLQQRLRSAQVIVTNLPGNLLALSSGNHIFLDNDAAGFGWFFDRTVQDDAEFAGLAGDTLIARTGSAARRFDLLTVLEHELGHMLGLDDLAATDDSLMSGVLARGTRRVPTATEVDALFAQ